MLRVFNLTAAPVALAAGNPIKTIPPTTVPGTVGPGVNVTAELKGLTGPNYAALQAQMTANILTFVWEDIPEYPTPGLAPYSAAAAAAELEAELASTVAGQGASKIALQVGSPKANVQAMVNALGSTVPAEGAALIGLAAGSIGANAQVGIDRLTVRSGTGAVPAAVLRVSVADWVDGDTTDIGADTYEFLPSANEPIELGATVDDTVDNLIDRLLTAGAVQPADAATFAFGGITFEWDDGGGVVPGNEAILIGADVAASLEAARIAIKAAPGVVNEVDGTTITVAGVLVEFYTMGNIPVGIGVGIDTTLAAFALAIANGTETVGALAGGPGALYLFGSDVPGGTPVPGAQACALGVPNITAPGVAVWDAADLSETGADAPTHEASGHVLVTATKATAMASGTAALLAVLPFTPGAGAMLLVQVRAAAGGLVAYDGAFALHGEAVDYTGGGVTDPVAGDIIDWWVKD
jgi:hypothetical protein